MVHLIDAYEKKSHRFWFQYLKISEESREFKLRIGSFPKWDIHSSVQIAKNCKDCKIKSKKAEGGQLL